MEEKISLYELQQKVRCALEPLSASLVWVTAEISEVKRNASGHWYFELADYDNSGTSVSAKARAVMWNRSAAMLIPFFETSTGARLSAGMHVLLKVQVQYSVVYGLSLSILDIDPSYTVGEAELQRRKIIERIEREGMMDMNSSIELPLLPKKIAVISSETAAGYRDFVKHLTENEYGISLYLKLYPAPMQGVEAPAGIVAALDAIARDTDAGAGYDAVVIIRGGGSVLELSCFDDYLLAINIAQFPLPVLTGIGHDHDFHVADMTAHTYFKTPTAVADFLIDLYTEQMAVLENLYSRAKSAISRRIGDRLNFLERSTFRIKNAASKLVFEKRNALQMLELRINAANPADLLKRGFLIAAKENGERIRSVNDITENETVRLIFKDGFAELVVKNKNTGHERKNEI